MKPEHLHQENRRAQLEDERRDIFFQKWEGIAVLVDMLKLTGLSRLIKNGGKMTRRLSAKVKYEMLKLQKEICKKT